jgi:hypothetical protein
MWKWLRHNVEPLQGMGAIVTALAAMTALVVIPLQIRAADNIQMRQTARDMYRGFLQLTLERPALANSDFCTATLPDEAIAYSAYMEYMLYTGEQLMITAPEDWASTLQGLMEGHANYFCAQTDWSGYHLAIQELILTVKADCPSPPECGAVQGG